MARTIINLLPKNLFSFFYLGLFLVLVQVASAQQQSNILASLDFDPKANGFSFPNYKNVGEKWKDDIAADDLIRMFGVNAVCKNKSAKNCVLDAAAREWIEHKLKAMNIGHCEGIGVASLRMNFGIPFKKRALPGNFQNGAKLPINLQLQQTLENYIAYYWITQTFQEIREQTQATAKLGPVSIVKMLIDSMNNKKDTFLLGMFKYENGRPLDGHAVTPFAVEDIGNQYKIHAYDNNLPGETRYIFVNKTGTQQWSYSSAFNRSSKPDYVGDKSTFTMQLTGTSWRDGKCFDPSFAEDVNTATGCGIETASLGNQPFFTKASFQQKPFFQDDDGEDAEFFLTGEGEMLVTDGDGNRLGYDPKTNRFYDEINGGEAHLLIGGFGADLPQYFVPYEETDEPYTIVFSGKNLDRESYLDFVFSAPGFTVGFDEIRLDPNETLTATISHDGQEISFTASADGETPEVFYSFDPEDDTDASYLTEIEGIELAAGKTLFYDFDFENGKLFFSDDDQTEDEYDIELTRINADGTEQVYRQNDLEIGKADKYEMDFGDWDGKGTMCFKDDEDNNGFADEECSEEASDAEEETDDNDDENEDDEDDEEN